MAQKAVVEEAIMEDSNTALYYIMQRDYINALEITEKSISVFGKNECGFLPHFLQGIIFSLLAGETKYTDMKCTYRLSAVESFFMSSLLLPRCLLVIHCFACSLFEVGELLNLTVYCKKAEDKAKEGLSSENLLEMLNPQLIPQYMIHRCKEDLKLVIKLAEAKWKPDAAETVFDISNRVEENDPNSGLTAVVEKGAEMRSFWAGMSNESKRDFFIVSIEKFKSYVERKYSSQRSEALKKALQNAKTNKNWKLWKCCTCSEEFWCSEECREHLEHKHAQKFRPPKDLVPQIVNEDCGEMISFGDWEPVNTTIAVNVESDRLASSNVIGSFKGWSKDLPLAPDKKRREILKEFGQLLKSLFRGKMLSCSLWDRLMHCAIQILKQSGVPESYIFDTGLDKKPQCFCFLEFDDLEMLLKYVRRLTTSICTDRVSRAVDGFWKNSRVKENILSDNEFSCLLLGNGMLIGEVNAFDDTGVIKVCAPSDHFARVSPQSDDIISWLLDCTQIDKEYVFERPIMVHNLDIWLAVSRILESECRNLETKYQRKLNMQSYSKGLIDLQKSLEKAHPPHLGEATYGSLLLKACRDRALEDDPDSDDTIGYLSVVRDVVEKRKSPRFDFEVSEVKEYLRSICYAYVQDNSVIESFRVLEKSVSNKLHLINSEILLHENSRKQLLEDLTRLSMFDYRLVILPLLKPFLLEELEKMIEIGAKESAGNEQEEKKRYLKQTHLRLPILF